MRSNFKLRQVKNLDKLKELITIVGESVLVDNVGVFTLRKGNYSADGIKIIKANELGYDYYFVKVLQEHSAFIAVINAFVDSIANVNRYYISSEFINTAGIYLECGATNGENWFDLRRTDEVDMTISNTHILLTARTTEGINQAVITYKEQSNGSIRVFIRNNSSDFFNGEVYISVEIKNFI
jgi:hypothetical protein